MRINFLTFVFHYSKLGSLHTAERKTFGRPMPFDKNRKRLGFWLADYGGYCKFIQPSGFTAPKSLFLPSFFGLVVTRRVWLTRDSFCEKDSWKGGWETRMKET